MLGVVVSVTMLVTAAGNGVRHKIRNAGARDDDSGIGRGLGRNSRCR